MHKSIMNAARTLDACELEVFRQLFFTGPTWDGDICSKTGRDGLVVRGLAVRSDGWQTLTEDGFIAAIDAGYGEKKEAWWNTRRRNAK